MSLNDLDLKIAKVLVRQIWREIGAEPLSVELAGGDAEWAWEREAERWLAYAGQCKREGRAASWAKFALGQQIPGFWDEWVGRYPGESDPILSKEFRYRDVYYMSGPVRQGREVTKGPTVS